MTGGVSGQDSRLGSARKRRTQVMFGPTGMEQPSRAAEFVGHGWWVQQQLCRHSRLEMPLAAIRRHRGRHGSEARMGMRAEEKRPSAEVGEA